MKVSPLGDDPGGDHRSQRGMREAITVWLLGLLCVVVGLAFTALLLDEDPTLADQRFAHLKTLLDVVVGPIVTLLSSVIGFYFGLQSARDAAAGSGERGNRG